MVKREQDLDCQSNSCRFGGRGKGGMRTNGRCTCIDKLISQITQLDQLITMREGEIKDLHEIIKEKDEAYTALLREAIRFAEMIHAGAWNAKEDETASDFLSRPEVQAKRKEQL